MFELIDLETKDGSYVATARVPKMEPRPDILVWGLRMFQKTDREFDAHPDRTEPHGRAVYEEVFAVTVVHTVPRETFIGAAG